MLSWNLYPHITIRAIKFLQTIFTPVQNFLKSWKQSAFEQLGRSKHYVKAYHKRWKTCRWHWSPGTFPGVQVTTLESLIHLQSMCVGTTMIVWPLCPPHTLVIKLVQQIIEVKTMLETMHSSVEVPLPSVVKHYNMFMGGVDKSDELVSYQRIICQTKKYWKTLLYHLLEIAAANSFILRKFLLLQSHQKTITESQFRDQLVQ